MYPIFIDKNEEFQCKISIEGADSKNATPRLFIKTKQWDLMFEGKIQDDECIIPLKKLKPLLEEGDSGDIRLEVVVDDTLLTPWENTFEAKVSRKAVVQVNEQKETFSKPKITVEVNKKPTIKETRTFTEVLKENGITSKNIRNKTKDVISLFNQYLKDIDNKQAKFLMENQKQFIKNILDNLK